MIETLTAAQEAALDTYYEKWLAIGLCTDRIDEGRARAAIELAYRCADPPLEPPKEIMFVKGPTEGKRLADSYGPNDTCWGQHDAAWLAFYDYIGAELGIDVHELEGLFATGKECGWWWPFEHVCIVSDRHIKALDHCADGPAIEYLDGTKIWLWRNHQCPQEYIEKPVTIEWIEKEENAEYRRILIERYGDAKYAIDSGAKLVATDDWGTLYKKASDPDIWTVKVICPTTAREYYLGIDPAAYGGRAAKEPCAAIASTWRRENGELVFKTPEDYVLDQQT